MPKLPRVLYGLPFLFLVLGPGPPKPAIKAIPLRDEVMLLDSRLTEAVWGPTEPATSFVQQRPETGRPAVGGSSVWVAFDANHLYIAADLHDPNPALIRGDERHRDASLERSDSFSVIIDTYQDHQSGFCLKPTSCPPCPTP